MNLYQMFYKGNPNGDPIPEDKYFSVRRQFSGYNTEWRRVRGNERTG